MLTNQVEAIHCPMLIGMHKKHLFSDTTHLPRFLDILF